MIRLTAEIKSRMRKMSFIHSALALVSAALLAFLYFTGRSIGLFPFSVILLLNLLSIALLAFYTRRETFP